MFALVTAAFVHIYLPQPVLPVLQAQFATDMVTVSFVVSAVILGMAISNLPFGLIADRWPIRPILLSGGAVVVAGALVCAVTQHLWLLIGARFAQGLFIPAATTCVVAYLAKNLPLERLNVVMGTYVSATVLGGMGGRLLGGWIHPPLHWRYAFVSAALLTVAATALALWVLPRSNARRDDRPDTARFRTLLTQRSLLRIYLCAAGSFAVFSSTFNYLPFRLAGAPFHLTTEQITLLYLVYIVGIFMGPLSGRIANRFGAATAMIGGVTVLAISLALVLAPSLTCVVLGLAGICTGFFTVHAAAVGALNRRLSSGQGRANALYVLFYYIGGWSGITLTGLAYKYSGWAAVVGLCWLMLLIPLRAGIIEMGGR